jgi:cobyrinic acid a,c-diamide synthase
LKIPKRDDNIHRLAMKETQGLIIAGMSGGSGKSVVTVGLIAALSARGKTIVPFKKGPDYIDAGWMQLAAGRRCYNLDPYLMSEEFILRSFFSRSRGADMAVVEGNRGLFDGVNAEGAYSTAELALLLKLPILLVVNCTKTTRTVAAMVLGCMKLDPRIEIRGVILNQIATERQRQIVTQAVENDTGLPVLGAFPRLHKDIFPMRHLGMIPHQEYSGTAQALSLLGKTVAESCDLDRILAIAEPIRFDNGVEMNMTEQQAEGTDVRIGVLQDAAFQFYYSENLEALERAGAEIVPINALQDPALPELDGLYIGGGFPETSARSLADNEGFRRSVREAADAGLPIYAECGGLIYLGSSIIVDDCEYPLAGVFPIRFGMSDKPQAHGYSIFTVEGPNPFYDIGLEIKGHEFRYSTVLEWQGRPEELALKMKRGKGFAGGRDGLTRKNVLALYTHVHAEGTAEWASGLLKRCRMPLRKD